MAEWTDALPDRGIGAFHTPAALSVLDDHAPGRMELVGAFKGDRPTALLPLFVRDPPVGQLVTSPPPGMGVPRLGPVLMSASPKRRKRERVNRKFAELVVEEFDLNGAMTLFTMACHDGFSDPRPFGWNGFRVETRFTYRIDLADRDVDDVLGAASKSLRREVRDGRELDVTVTRGGTDALRQVYRETTDRYAEQGRDLPMTWPYVRDLFEALGEMARVYVVRGPDGDYLTGITVIYSPEAATFWQGGSRTIHEGVAVNSLLHVAIMEDVIGDPPRDSVEAYDLYGANTERLCQYKSKFGGELVPYYAVDSGGYRMRIAEMAYELVVR